jgi:hypothetical protein
LRSSCPLFLRLFRRVLPIGRWTTQRAVLDLPSSGVTSRFRDPLRDGTRISISIPPTLCMETIDLASETSDEPDFDSGLKGAQGFETSKFPVARFASKRFVRKSGNNYLAEGVLSLHGISRDIELPFTLAISGRSAHVTGSAHVLRTDYGLGNGTWSAPSPVSHDVSINVDLTATQ